MSNSNEDIQQPNYMEILFVATNYPDAINRVKPHLHNTLKLSTKNSLQPKAKATPMAFCHCGENDDHKNDFLDEENNVCGNSRQ